MYDQFGEEGLKGGMNGMPGGTHFTATNPEELFARVRVMPDLMLCSLSLLSWSLLSFIAINV
jgi:hypothetical protein